MKQNVLVLSKESRVEMNDFESKIVFLKFK